MTQKVSKKKAVDSKDVAGGSSKKAVVTSNYVGYFYAEIDKLWKEIMVLQTQNNELRSLVKGVA